MKLQWNTPAVTRRPEETWALAAAVLAAAPPGAVLALHGELGSGKTCFVQGLALALGIEALVTSPTFTLINEYRGARPLYHLDLYRIHSPDEALALGLDEVLAAEGIKAIEWAERIAGLLPPDTVHVDFAFTPQADERQITVHGPAGGFK